MKLTTGKVSIVVEEPEILTEWVIIESTPTNAQVYVDDKPVGKTPFSGEYSMEQHQYRVEFPMYHADAGLFTLSTSSGRQKITVNILIRPRPGNFVYSSDEFEIMCEDIKEFKKLNINGIVSGILTKEGNVDIEKTKILVELSRPLEFTFHRVFDNSKNINLAIDEVIKTGADRLLTSGGKASVNDSKETIIKLHKEYGSKIIIMSGGGINLDNAAFFIQNGIKEIHLSAGSFERDNAYYNHELTGMGHSVKNGEIGYKFSNIQLIKKICEL